MIDQALQSIKRFVRALRAQFDDPALIENFCTYLCQLRQGSMTVKDYSTKFHNFVAEIRDWPQSMKVGPLTKASPLYPG